MTYEIGLTLSLITLAIVLFVTERLSVDLTALLLLVALALTGLVTAEEAIAGFSSPAVITVWAVFILSGGLARTGIANMLSRQIVRIAGKGEARLIFFIMLLSGLFSAFMNNIGVTALMLPVVLDIARQTERSPSKLLMPLSFGSLLGGVTTLIGTPPNILASGALRDLGLQPFSMFDFLPVGGIALLAGILFMLLVGRHLLPERDVAREMQRNAQDVSEEVFELDERLFIIHIPTDSPLAGVRLIDSHLGSALYLTVIGILRENERQLAPSPETLLQGNDRLLVVGRPDRLLELNGVHNLVIEQDAVREQTLKIENLTSTEVLLFEVIIPPGAALVGQTLAQIGLRARYGINVLAIRRLGVSRRTQLQEIPLEAEDALLVQGTREEIAVLCAESGLCASEPETLEVYRLQERLLALDIPEGSNLVGKTLQESHLRDAFGLAVLSILREGVIRQMPAPDEHLQAGDRLLVEGKLEDVRILLGMRDLQIETGGVPDLKTLESEDVGMAEVALSPHTTLVGKTLRQVDFRERYGLSVLAIWRRGRAYRFQLRDMELQFGDSLLVYGARSRLRLLAKGLDFLMLTEAFQTPPKVRKAPWAILIMLAFMIVVALDLVPLTIASVAGAVLMVLSGCLTMEEAYRSIEWKAVFLIAGLLPLGTAMQNSGAAQYLAERVLEFSDSLSVIGLLAGLFLITVAASQVINSSVLILLMMPIAISAAQSLNLSPHALVMLVVLAASSNFISPVSHPSNLLVMGPGGYRVRDFFVVGSLLTVVMLLIALFVLPLFWAL